MASHQQSLYHILLRVFWTKSLKLFECKTKSYFDYVDDIFVTGKVSKHKFLNFKVKYALFFNCNEYATHYYINFFNVHKIFHHVCCKNTSESDICWWYSYK
jgi:hypothetical protein